MLYYKLLYLQAKQASKTPQQIKERQNNRTAKKLFDDKPSNQWRSYKLFDEGGSKF